MSRAVVYDPDNITMDDKCRLSRLIVPTFFIIIIFVSIFTEQNVGQEIQRLSPVQRLI